MHALSWSLWEQWKGTFGRLCSAAISFSGGILPNRHFFEIEAGVFRFIYVCYAERGLVRQGRVELALANLLYLVKTDWLSTCWQIRPKNAKTRLDWRCWWAPPSWHSLQFSLCLTTLTGQPPLPRLSQINFVGFSTCLLSKNFNSLQASLERRDFWSSSFDPHRPFCPWWGCTCRV